MSQPRKIYLVIHGHFYQPPRENPWTQAIPRQESAQPDHDWNERILKECYNPNTRSRVLDVRGHIAAIQNNFAWINFNLGPTLFGWLEEHHPETYRRVLEADRQSCAAHDGHGNAIAQAYNHIILPLANERDQLTQIRWGLREFRYRYGRTPEAIWLAETAINEQTVRCLLREKLSYVILSPTQAYRARRIGEQQWHDVSQNTIDTTQPYRIVLSDEAETEAARAPRLQVRWYAAWHPAFTRGWLMRVSPLAHKPCCWPGSMTTPRP